ncbi:MAG: rod-binding protein [Planctomycetaceae bacterium]|nr:rod-binding protein [Planctomycetaceae bacterium]
MISPVSALNSASSARMQQLSLSGSLPKPPADDARQTFQDFVAGTFYGQMLKSLRSTEQKPAYMHGGQAEEMFRAQLDQQIAGQLASDQGAVFADPLFQSFSRPAISWRESAGSASGQPAAPAVPAAPAAAAE